MLTSNIGASPLSSTSPSYSSAAAAAAYSPDKAHSPVISPSRQHGIAAGKRQLAVFTRGPLPPETVSNTQLKAAGFAIRKLECSRAHVKLLLGKKTALMQLLLQEIGPMQVKPT